MNVFSVLLVAIGLLVVVGFVVVVGIHVFLTAVGHYAPWEQPETVGPILRKFFDSVTG